MNRMVAILSVVILGSCATFAQSGTGNLSGVAKDTLEVNNEIRVKADTFYHPLVVRYDALRYSSLKYTYKAAFKFKYDPFWEKMKEPWIGDVLKNIFF